MFITLQQSDLHLNAPQNRVNMRPRFPKVFRHLSLANLYTRIHSEICAQILWIILKEKQYSIFFFFPLTSNEPTSKMIIQTFYFMASSCRDKCYFLCLETCSSFCTSVPIQWTFLPTLIQHCPCFSLNKIYSCSRDICKNLTCVSWENRPLSSVALFCSCLYPKEGLFITCLLPWLQPFWSRPFLFLPRFFALLSNTQWSETSFVFWHP